MEPKGHERFRRHPHLRLTKRSLFVATHVAVFNSTSTTELTTTTPSFFLASRRKHICASQDVKTGNCAASTNYTPHRGLLVTRLHFRRIVYCVNCGTEGVNLSNTSNHRLQWDYVSISFVTHTFDQRHWCLQAQACTLPISTHSPLHRRPRTTKKESMGRAHGQFQPA